jgi:hypothetical protein
VAAISENKMTTIAMKTRIFVNLEPFIIFISPKPDYFEIEYQE